ncbi:MAG: AAA family ATPase [Sedimenticola sp.]
MVEIVENVVVKRIRYKSDNGCVFKATVLDSEGNETGKDINVLLSGKLTSGRGFRLYEGQCFKVSAKRYTEYINKNTGEIEEQLKAVNILESPPQGKNFIAYIAFNDAFPNVGLKTVTAVYKEYSNDIYKILDEKNVSALRRIKGVSDDKAFTLINGWHKENKGKVIKWLDLYGLPAWLGIKLTKAYDNDTLRKIDSDPYRLIAFMVSWSKVDQLALNNFGFQEDDPRRLHGAVAEVLFEAYSEDGNTALRSEPLAKSVERILGKDMAKIALKQVYSDGGFVMVNSDLFQSRGACLQEKYIAQSVLTRCTGQNELIELSIEKALDDWQQNNYQLTDEQLAAVLSALTNPLSVITGGAGVGKTSVLEAFNYVLNKTGGHSIQMALAGRAAKRMQEATGYDAITIAGFLYKLDKDKINSATHIVIDECSMVDLHSMVRIFRTLQSSQKIVLVGDSTQLPPVGAGKVFHFLSDATFVPVTNLTKVWRQDETTGIPMVSQDFRNGIWKGLRGYNGRKPGVSIVNADTKNVLSMVEQAFGELGGIKEDQDVKIICPTTKDSGWGTLGINRRMSDIYAGNNEQVFLGYDRVKPKPTGLRIGDTVIATKNNWVKGVMNGTLGRIQRMATEQEVRVAIKIDQPIPVISVLFDIGEVLLDEDDIASLQWGYAITCHKAQGSQFRRVIVPLVTNIMIDRTWVYTALTRGVEQVVFIGDSKLIKKAVESNPIALERTSGLYEHIEQIRMYA